MIRAPEFGKSESGIRNSGSSDSESAKRISLGRILSNDRMAGPILVVAEDFLSTDLCSFLQNSADFDGIFHFFADPNDLFCGKVDFPREVLLRFGGGTRHTWGIHGA